MALLWHIQASSASPKSPTTAKTELQLRTPRSFHVTLSLVLLILISGVVILQSLSRIHRGICHGPSPLASSGLCASVLQTGWNLFYHLGGNGPWIRKADLPYYHDSPLPQKCSVDQVHMVWNKRSGDKWPFVDSAADLSSCHGMLKDIRPEMPAHVGRSDIRQLRIAYLLD